MDTTDSVVDTGATEPLPSDSGESEGEAWFVLVGGEAHETQGVGRGRELMHTSLSYVAQAYASLRTAGVPRDRIITIVQLKDYLDGLGMADDEYPKSMYLKECNQLLAEGGADYDHRAVNPHTIWSVLLGKTSAQCPKVVPTNALSVTFAIYSHGDSHPVTAGAKEARSLDPLRHEWFAHMPYPSSQSSALTQQMTQFVAVDGARLAGPARNKPFCYLYATQLRAVFAEMFRDNPNRPVIGLLNYCRSGGGLEFMRRDAARRLLGVDTWPLFLMSSCQAEKDALVGGLWACWFQLLARVLNSKSPQHAPHVQASDCNKQKQQQKQRPKRGPNGHRRGRGRGRGEEALQQLETVRRNGNVTLQALFADAQTLYYRQNAYQLKDFVKTHAYASNVGQRTESFDFDLSKHICSAPGGLPDYPALEKMQREYRDGTRYARYGKQKVKIWHPRDWGGKEVSLVDAVKKSRRQIARPEAQWGSGDIADMQVGDLFFNANSGNVNSGIAIGSASAVGAQDGKL